MAADRHVVAAAGHSAVASGSEPGRAVEPSTVPAEAEAAEELGWPDGAQPESPWVVPPRTEDGELATDR